MAQQTKTDLPRGASRWHCLRRAGVMVVAETSGPWLPVIVYWGKDLGELTD